MTNHARFAEIQRTLRRSHDRAGNRLAALLIAHLFLQCHCYLTVGAAFSYAGLPR
jgi:hypothetical protein